MAKFLGFLINRIDPDTLYRTIVFLSFAFSIGGILVGAFITTPADGGRGGAVALALFIILAKNNYGTNVQTLLEQLQERRATVRARLKAAQNPISDCPLTEKTGKVPGDELLGKRLAADAQTQEVQNGAMVIATFFGTLFWGFGDIIAGFLQYATGLIKHLL